MMSNAENEGAAEGVRANKRQICAISGRERPKRDLVNVDTLRPALSDRIRQDFPDLPAESLISSQELARYRNLYVEELLKQEHGEFTELDRAVADSIASQDTIAANVDDEFETH